MASHLDLAARLEAVGVDEELYTGNPPALVAKVAQLVRAGRWPICINTKGATPDNVLIVMPLRGYESMLPRTGFEGDDNGA